MTRADLVDGIKEAICGAMDTHATVVDKAEAVVAYLEASGALRAEVPGDAELDALVFAMNKFGWTISATQVTALRQQLAAAQAERTECCLQALTSEEQAREVYAAQVKAEAERDALLAPVSYADIDKANALFGLKHDEPMALLAARMVRFVLAERAALKGEPK